MLHLTAAPLRSTVAGEHVVSCTRKMKKTDIVMYCNVMEEIKRRTSVIDFFITGSGHALFEPTTLESMALQIRKILELIAMATLVANKNEYKKVYSNFAKAWNAEYLLKDNDYLTKKEFTKVYKKCGAIMHASNPLGRKIGYEYYKNSIPDWRQKIINLLNNHQIRLIGHEGFYLIHMKEDRDDKVHFYEFKPVESSSS